MQKDCSCEQELYLPYHLLEDDDLKTSPSLKRDNSDDVQFCFSGSPILYHFDYTQLEEDPASDEETRRFFQESGGPVTMHLSQKQQHFEDFYPRPIQSIRKFSLQTENEYKYDYLSYPSSPFYQSLTPEEELMNNLAQVCLWAKDQHGSRTVQNILETGAEYTKELIFNLIFKQAGELITDRFGNYVFQKIFEKGLQSHKQQLFTYISAHLLELADHCFGCRVVQKAIEFTATKPDLQAILIKDLQPHALRLIQSQNGNHVIQKCCEVVQTSRLNDIADQIIHNLPKLAFHAFGCRVIQKYLENSEGQPREQIILRKLLGMVVQLSQCQYGNYVMQHIVMHCKQQQEEILNIFFKNFMSLSVNKYASNVMEKAIRTSPLCFKEKVVMYLINSDNLTILAKHQYGNYVVQNLMERVSKEKKALMRQKLKDNAQEISQSQYGKHVLMQLDKLK